MMEGGEAEIRSDWSKRYSEDGGMGETQSKRLICLTGANWL